MGRGVGDGDGPRGILGGARGFGKKFAQWAIRSGSTQERCQTSREATARDGETTREKTTGEMEVDWELPPELLDGGQGKAIIDPQIVCTRPDREGSTTGDEGRVTDGDKGDDQQQGGTWEPPTGLPPHLSQWAGLQPLVLKSMGQGVTGETKGALRRQAARERKTTLASQRATTQWTSHLGAFMPSITESLETRQHRGGMCPSGLALHHPAASVLREWSLFGCPAMTGREWRINEMTAAIERGPHESALTPEAIEHFAAEVLAKVAVGQARVVNWDDIKKCPPKQLKISPIAAIPHKLKAFQSILDLSFSLRLKEGGGDHVRERYINQDSTSGVNRPNWSRS